MDKRDKDDRFRYNVMIDVVKDGKYILAPGQVFCVWESGWLGGKSHDVCIELNDVVTYADRKGEHTEYCLLSEATGQACYLKYTMCLDSHSPQGRSFLGYGCGLKKYCIKPEGIQFKSVKRIRTSEIADRLVHSRVPGYEDDKMCPSPYFTEFGTPVPAFMAEVNEEIKNSVDDSLFLTMYEPGVGSKELVELPIPVLLTEYKDTITGYSEEDIKLHKKLYDKAIRKFLSRYGITKLYIGWPNEGQTLYRNIADAEKLFTRYEYDTYNPFKSFRVVGCGPWNFKDRFEFLDGTQRGNMFKAIKSGITLE